MPGRTTVVRSILPVRPAGHGRYAPDVSGVRSALSRRLQIRRHCGPLPLDPPRVTARSSRSVARSTSTRRPALREQLVDLVADGKYHLVVDMERRRLPRLDRARRPGRRPQAGPRPRRLAAPGLHPGAHPQDLPHHRADQGLPDPRLGRRGGRAPPSGRCTRHGRQTPSGTGEHGQRAGRAPLQRAAGARPHRPAGRRRGRAPRRGRRGRSTRSGWRSARPAPGRSTCTGSTAARPGPLRRP